MFNEFLREIREKGIAISFSGGKLLYSGPEQYIDDELIAKLKKYKPRLLKYYWPSDCPNLMPINTEGSKIPFVLLHAGEANYSLQEYLGKEQPFYGFFYIGSAGEKIRYKSAEAFAGEYLNQLKKVVPNGPYVLGGFSFGGILAYEMAVQLQNQGIRTPVLVLVDCGIPSYDKACTPGTVHADNSSTLRKFFKNIYYWNYFHALKLFCDFSGFLKISLPPKYRNSYIIWTYSRLMRSYKPNTTFEGEILLFKAEANKSEDIYLGWDRLCEKINVALLKGSHQTMYNNKESIQILREKIGEILNRANSN